MLGACVIASFVITVLALRGPTEGKVISKEFDPAHKEINVSIETTAYGTNKEERLVAYPDRWFVTVTPDGTSQWRWQVPANVYNRATNGEWIKK